MLQILLFSPTLALYYLKQTALPWMLLEILLENQFNTTCLHFRLPFLLLVLAGEMQSAGKLSTGECWRETSCSLPSNQRSCTACQSGMPSILQSWPWHLALDFSESSLWSLIQVGGSGCKNLTFEPLQNRIHQRFYHLRIQDGANKLPYCAVPQKDVFVLHRWGRMKQTSPWKGSDEVIINQIICTVC